MQAPPLRIQSFSPLYQVPRVFSGRRTASARLRGQAREQAGRDREGRNPAPQTRQTPERRAPGPDLLPCRESLHPAISGPHTRPCPRPPRGSRAPGICLCPRKNVTLTYLSPQLLSVLFQNDITESNHEIYMGGCRVDGRRGRQLPARHHMWGSLCAGFN